MNLFGKILTVIILVLSIVFCAIAIMAGQGVKDWKTLTGNLKSELETQKELIEGLKKSGIELDKEIARERLSRARALAELQSRKRRLEDEVQSKENQLQEEKAKATLALTQLEDASKRTTELDEKVEEITKLNNDHVVSIATTAQKLSTVENKLIQLQTDLTTKKERLDQLVTQLTEYKSVLIASGIDVDFSTKHIEPKIAAQVTGVLNDIVVFSAGRDDGIREGHEFEVYHGSKYVGLLKVIDLHGGNNATGRLFGGRNAQIADSVVTAKNPSKG